MSDDSNEPYCGKCGDRHRGPCGVPIRPEMRESLITPPSDGHELTQLVPHDGESMAEFLSLDVATKRLRALRSRAVRFETIYAEWTGAGQHTAHQADLQRVAYTAIEKPDHAAVLAEALEDVSAFLESASPPQLSGVLIDWRKTQASLLNKARAALEAWKAGK